jgi:esterase/lipase superfamily enzyme
MTQTEFHQLDATQLGGRTAEVTVHGHYGRPIMWFPSEAGSVHDFVSNGILDAVRGAVDEGRIKIFCVPSYDTESWSASWKPLGDRAKAHLAYEAWIVGQVVPFFHAHCAGRTDIATAGTSLGAFHAVVFALRQAHLFPHAVAMSGSYDPRRWRGWGEHTDDVYFTNPMEFVPGLHGGHLDYLRSAVRITLVVGSGQWEDTTGSLDSTKELADVLQSKGIGNDLFIWGTEWPHDWPSWRAQAALYLPALG